MTVIYDCEDTIVAIASAAGGGARGILRLSGPSISELLRLHFTPVGGPPFITPRRPTCQEGNWRLPDGQALPVWVYCWPTSRSYTRQPTAEVHTVGSPPLLNRVLAQLCQHGARLAQPGEFTLRAFLAGRLDLTQAEAVLGVIDAHDQRQLAVALTQLAGGLSQDLVPLRDQLLNLLADIEAGLDFVDEDIQFIEGAEIEAMLHAVDKRLSELLQRMSDRTRSEWLPRIVLRGRPNVGKSTLWNALIKRDDALVSDVPGTTRDYLEATISVANQNCRLIDSAGMDETLASGIDQLAQGLANRVHVQADIVLLCLDATRSAEAWEWIELRDVSSNNLVVLNKCDRDADPFLSGLPSDIQVQDQGATLRMSWSTGDQRNAPCTRDVIRLERHDGSGAARIGASARCEPGTPFSRRKQFGRSDRHSLRREPPTGNSSREPCPRNRNA